MKRRGYVDLKNDNGTTTRIILLADGPRREELVKQIKPQEKSLTIKSSLKQFFSSLWVYMRNLREEKGDHSELKLRTSEFRFDGRSTALLDELAEKTGSSSRSEVLRKALYLLDIAATAHHDENQKLIIRNGHDGSEKEITLY